MKRIVLGFWILKSGEVSFCTIGLYISIKAQNTQLEVFPFYLYVNWISNVCIINETFFPEKGHDEKTVAPDTMKNVPHDS